MINNRFDVHQHIITKQYLSALERIGIEGTSGLHFPEWSEELALGVLDRQHIQTAILSISSPGVYFGNKKAAGRLAREVNDNFCELVGRHPGRFGALGHLPLPDVDAALLELERLVNELKLDGVILLSSVGGQYLGDAAFEELFAELNRLSMVVFIHPTLLLSAPRAQLDLPEFMLEAPFDTTRAVANLVYSGTLERYPDIRFILAHAGGTIPFLEWRMSIAAEIDPRLKDKLPHSASHYLRKLYFDTAMSPSAPALAALKEFVGANHILFGSDWPMVSESVAGRTVSELEELPFFDERTKELISCHNATQLFARFRS
jgi:predicted TIM-barrel fold metal-dependent hydrolase